MTQRVITWDEYRIENNEALSGIDVTSLDSVLHILKSLRSRGGTLWIAGNGGSAATASHAAADLGKTVKSSGASPVFCVALSDMVAMQSAYANDISFERGFSETLMDFAKPEDVLWVISVSGTSPNLMRAIEAATSKNIPVIATVGAKGSGIGDKSTAIVIPSADYQVVENAHTVLMHWFTKAMS